MLFGAWTLDCLFFHFGLGDLHLQPPSVADINKIFFACGWVGTGDVMKLATSAITT